MKDVVSLVSVLAVVLVASVARALPTQLAYDALSSSRRMGSIRFDLDEEVEGGCRYEMTWDFGGNVPGESCSVDEMHGRGAGSCYVDAERPFSTIVMNSQYLDCWGFDGTGQAGPVYNMVLVERGSDGALFGIIQLDSASGGVSGLNALPRGSVGGPVAGTRLALHW